MDGGRGVLAGLARRSDQEKQQMTSSQALVPNTTANSKESTSFERQRPRHLTIEQRTIVFAVGNTFSQACHVLLRGWSRSSTTVNDATRPCTYASIRFSKHGWKIEGPVHPQHISSKGREPTLTRTSGVG